MADRVQLKQVFMNLISTDRRHEETSGEVSLHQSEVRRWSTLISVSDAGVGLPPDSRTDLHGIFTTKDNGTGWGCHQSVIMNPWWPFVPTLLARAQPFSSPCPQVAAHAYLRSRSHMAETFVFL